MKDLYTFDSTSTEARKTYEEVYDAYKRIFTDLNIPFAIVSTGCQSEV